MDEEKKIKDQLSVLEDQHRQLDKKIGDGLLCMLEMQRLKKQKLQLRDQMAKLQASLLPDIIA